MMEERLSTWRCATTKSMSSKNSSWKDFRSTPFNSLLVTDLIDTADNNGDTILHLAAKINCLEVSGSTIER
ncbi:hypothetical protein MRB53_013171 [Persea americana]|uniref:Uncharacterized protein n=1 Tax=Persea americana TaxID=3435 RepID=A0ACC2K7E6_PERAE|nr:hypothetical protein MRB53_013171 [Persea americana]